MCRISPLRLNRLCLEIGKAVAWMGSILDERIVGQWRVVIRRAVL